MRRCIAAIVAVLVVGPAFPAAAGREDQWVFRQERGDGSLEPTAVFLSWNYSEVVFRVTCHRARRELVVEYYGDFETKLTARDVIILGRISAVPLRTRLINGRLEGRVKVTPQILSVLGGPGDLEIDAPTSTGDPWYTGRSEPLIRVARACT